MIAFFEDNDQKSNLQERGHFSAILNNYLANFFKIPLETGASTLPSLKFMSWVINLSLAKYTDLLTLTARGRGIGHGRQFEAPCSGRWVPASGHSPRLRTSYPTLGSATHESSEGQVRSLCCNFAYFRLYLSIGRGTLLHQRELP